MSNASIIQCVGDLEAVVAEWEQRFTSPGTGFPPIWYRGHARNDWELNPGVLRTKFKDFQKANGYPSEQIIITEFRRRATAFVSEDISPIAFYFLAQHHRLPTRLLDWTRNPLAALFFAASDCLDADGELIVFDPRFANPVGLQFDPLLNMRDERVVATMKWAFQKAPLPNGMTPCVLPLLPALQHARMVVQDSAFTLHMPGASEILEKDDHIRKCVVPRSAKSKLMATLRRMGVNWASIYCDLDHLAKEICTAWDIKT